MGYLCPIRAGNCPCRFLTLKLMRYADVILPLATPPMTFAVDEAMRPGLRTGMRVMVQLGARKFYAGIVSRLHDEPPAYKTIKPIVRIVDEREAATPEQLRLWEWISSYYMCPPGMVMRAALPAKLKLDGYSEDETLRSGYRVPLVPHIGLHPTVGSEEQLHAALDSLSRAAYPASCGSGIPGPRGIFARGRG